MAKYSNGSEVVEAVQFIQRNNREEVEEFFSSFGVELNKGLPDTESTYGIYLYEIKQSVFPGNYIVKGEQGTFHTYERDVFEAEYKKVV